MNKIYKAERPISFKTNDSNREFNSLYVLLLYEALCFLNWFIKLML
ncbi:hypothetical protein [Spiroplasma floricola]|nr:hypothetical protein [Spiroplasma floricola]